MKWPPKLPKGSPLTVTPRGYVARIAGKTRWICGKVPAVQALARYHVKAAALVAERKPIVAPTSLAAGSRVTMHYVLSRWLLDRRQDAEAGKISADTWAQYKLSAKRIDAVVGTHPTDSWVPSMTEDLARQLATAHSADFAARAIGHLQTACRHAAERDWCPPVRLGESVVATLTSRPRAQMKWILYSPADVRRILAAAKQAVTGATRPYSRVAAEQMLAFIYLALNGGYGSKESSDLTKAEIDLAGARIRSVREKTGVTHVVPLWPETVEALRPVLAQRPEDPLLFRTRQGKPWCRSEGVVKNDKLDKSTGADNVNWTFTNLVRPLGLKIEGQGFYKLKHLFATTAGEALDTDAAKILRGHALGGSADNYVAVSEERLRKVVDHVRHVLLINPLT